MTTSAVSSFTAPILVVEDSDEDFDTLREVAAAIGVSRPIYRAMSGGDILPMLRGESGVHLPILLQLPALIVLDLNSHGVDGREALVVIKADARFKAIPVVVLTTSVNPKDVEYCYQAGANAYHVKPVRHDQYLLLLRALMHYWLDTVTPHATLVKVE
jgi:CheY-like chemotaxis protein